MRRGAEWRFGGLGARRIGLRPGDGLYGSGRGARCEGGRVGVGLIFIFDRDGEWSEGREGDGRTDQISRLAGSALLLGERVVPRRLRECTRPTLLQI